MTRLLLVTNDFPPRPGGIQSFVHGVVSRLPSHEVVVLTSRWRGWQEWDAAQPFRVVRHDTRVLLPTPAVRRQAVELATANGCTEAWFGAAAPLGLLAPALRAVGVRRVVASTHGHEVGWAALPGARTLLRRVAAGADVVTYLTDYTRGRLAGPLAPYDDRLTRLVPGIDTDRFAPDRGGAAKRAELGLTERPVVVGVSRLMPRKGQDRLIAALPEIRRRVPGTALVLVGGGPSRQRLQRLAAECGVAGDVTFTGSIAPAELPAWYGVGDVFAMPCRERLGGLDVEGLGIVFLEAAACGLPVVAGVSGGSVDAVVDGETGHLVRDDPAEIVAAVVGLLRDRGRAQQFGRRGRAWVVERWGWAATMRDFAAMFDRPGEPPYRLDPE